MSVETTSIAVGKQNRTTQQENNDKNLFRMMHCYSKILTKKCIQFLEGALARTCVSNECAMKSFYF